MPNVPALHYRLSLRVVPSFFWGVTWHETAADAAQVAKDTCRNTGKEVHSYVTYMGPEGLQNDHDDAGME